MLPKELFSIALVLFWSDVVVLEIIVLVLVLVVIFSVVESAVILVISMYVYRKETDKNFKVIDMKRLYQ